MRSILAILLILLIIGVLFGDLSLSVNMFNIGNSMSIASGGAGSWTATQSATGGDIGGKVVAFFLVVIAVGVITRPKKHKGSKWDER